MRRRITSAIVGVTAFVLLVIGIPLGIVIEQSILRSEVVELQSTAAETLTEIALPIDVLQLGALENEPDAPPAFQVYDTAARLVFGDGPAIGDAAVDVGLTGQTGSTTSNVIVVATAITDENEQVVGVLRLTESMNGVEAQTRRAWLAMLAAGAGAVGGAWLIAGQLSKRLAGPVLVLADAASRLGDGGLFEEVEPTGIAEIDLLNATLRSSSSRVNEALARERQFSADVSHQLRTPLAGLRLKLEASQLHDPGGAAITRAALDDLDRLEDTVEHLLAFARDAVPLSSTSSLSAAARDAAERWGEQVAAAGRSITIEIRSDAEVQMSQSAVQQVLDVLIDNALDHGRGTISLTARTIAGGSAIDVSDEGSVDPTLTEAQLFARHLGTNHGIGLSLARSIGEAEGGRLSVVSRSPTTFSLVALAVPTN